MNLSVAAESLRSRGALVSFSSSGRPHGRPSRRWPSGMTSKSRKVTLPLLIGLHLLADCAHH